VSSCPLTYSSGIASHKRDVLGAWFLSILAGRHRYAHIIGLRGDGVSPQILGMSKIVSEDSLRRALARMTADESRNWLWPQLLASVQGALDTPWILDIDTTVKTLFGKQSGAQVSYNPHKPGRPGHALHTYFVSHLRMVLDVVVSLGEQHSAAHARHGLSDVLDSLNKEQLPALARGDCGFGNEPFFCQRHRARRSVFILVLVGFLATDVGFIGFHNALQESILVVIILLATCLTDALKEKPGRLLCDPNLLRQLKRRDALTGRQYEVEDIEPLVQRDVRPPHNGASPDRKHQAADRAAIIASLPLSGD
jgi:hypothetical protein